MFENLWLKIVVSRVWDLCPFLLTNITDQLIKKAFYPVCVVHCRILTCIVVLAGGCRKVKEPDRKQENRPVWFG